MSQHETARTGQPTGESLSLGDHAVRPFAMSDCPKRLGRNRAPLEQLASIFPPQADSGCKVYLLKPLSVEGIHVALGKLNLLTKATP